MKGFKVKRRNRMAQKWNYAEMTKAAKLAGGPEKYVDMLEKAGKAAGKNEMLPWVGVAAVSASLLTLASIKIVSYFKPQKGKKEIEIINENEEIAKGRKLYDSSHKTNEKGGQDDEQKISRD